MFAKTPKVGLSVYSVIRHGFENIKNAIIIDIGGKNYLSRLSCLFFSCWRLIRVWFGFKMSVLVINVCIWCSSDLAFWLEQQKMCGLWNSTWNSKFGWTLSFFVKSHKLSCDYELQISQTNTNCQCNFIVSTKSQIE